LLENLDVSKHKTQMQKEIEDAQKPKEGESKKELVESKDEEEE